MINDIYLLLSSIEGVTSETIQKLEEIINLQEFFDLKEVNILNIKNININVKKSIVKYKSKNYLNEVKNNLIKSDIKYTTINDDLYPKNLRNIYNAPKVIFYKGDISSLNKNIGISIVGSRKCTQYGKYATLNFSRELSSLGINILSGLAMGIDSYAHEGSFGNIGKTTAVIASSVDNITPKVNLKLADKILSNGGCILSEYFIGQKVHTSNFVKRNRILSGISDGIIVIEAARKSGSLITADFGLEQGKNIFAVPGNINLFSSEGCNNLIKQGAKLITSLDDILEEYKVIDNIHKKTKEIDKNELNEYSLKIIDIIKENGVSHIDEICDKTKLDIKIVNCNINELLLSDVIIEMDNKHYSLNI